MLEATTCMTINQTIVATPMVAAEAPVLAHGEIEDKPSPTPSASKATDRAAATKAPAMTAAHDTPGAWPSFPPGVSARVDGYAAAAVSACCIEFLLVYIEQRLIVVTASAAVL